MRRILLWLLSFTSQEQEVTIPKPPDPLPPSFFFELTQPEETPSMEVKQGIVRLVQNEDWKWFEQYLTWKMGVAARQAFAEKSFEDDKFARDRRVEVGFGSEITQDLRAIWVEVMNEDKKTKEERDEEKALNVPDFS